MSKIPKNMPMTKKLLGDMNNATKDLVEIMLKSKGYNGLYNPDVGGEPCGCEIGDLKPCDSDASKCFGGFKHKDGLMWPESESKGNSEADK